MGWILLLCYVLPGCIFYFGLKKVQMWNGEEQESIKDKLIILVVALAPVFNIVAAVMAAFMWLADVGEGSQIKNRWWW